jgi:thiamine pyrophosphokinase
MIRAVIFVNGELTASPGLNKLLQPDDYIIAVNGGTHHALRMGVVPHVIIGDLDSLSPADRSQISSASVTILESSPRKDETDLELALRHAVQHDADEIVLVAALGGRIDHSTANLFLLALPELKGRDVQIIEGEQRIFLIRDEAMIAGAPGDLVSILPVGGDAVGVSNEGLEWPLHNETLPLGSPRGMSNVLIGESASIRVNHGMLLCIVTHPVLSPPSITESG